MGTTKLLLLDSLLQEKMSSDSGDKRQEGDYVLFDAMEDRKKGETDKRFAVLGSVLGLGGVGYMARNFKNRDPNMKISVYLIHTRLLAQGTVIGVLTLGMLHQMYQKKFKN